MRLAADCRSPRATEGGERFFLIVASIPHSVRFGGWTARKFFFIFFIYTLDNADGGCIMGGMATGDRSPANIGTANTHRRPRQ